MIRRVPGKSKCDLLSIWLYKGVHDFSCKTLESYPLTKTRSILLSCWNFCFKTLKVITKKKEVMYNKFTDVLDTLIS